MTNSISEKSSKSKTKSQKSQGGFSSDDSYYDEAEDYELAAIDLEDQRDKNARKAGKKFDK